MVAAEKVCFIALPTCKHNVRALLTNESDHVPQRVFFTPIAQGLGESSGESKIEKAGDAEPGAVVLAGPYHLYRATNPERRTEVTADGIASGFPTTECKKCDLVSLAP